MVPLSQRHAIRAGLVDEYDLLIAPVIAGGGTAYWPHGVSLRLELLDERRFDNGMVQCPVPGEALTQSTGPEPANKRIERTSRALS